MLDNPRYSRLKKTFVYRILRYFLNDLVESKIKLSKNIRITPMTSPLNGDGAKVNFNRIALVNLLVSKKSDCAYLEIGCATNDLFNAVPALNKIGVDPQAGGTVRKTSDDFFLANETNFDVVFIDGLHTYDQVRKDVVNSIKFLNPGGWIRFTRYLPGNWRNGTFLQ